MNLLTPTIASKLLAYLVMPVLLVGALVISSRAEVVYTPVHVSIPINQSYNVDLNADGVTDFTLTSKYIEASCQSGDKYVWTLTVASASGNSVVVDPTHAGSSNAAALPAGVAVNSSQVFYPGLTTMAGLYWGDCGTGTLGEWLNIPTRYLGLQFRDAGGNTHYGWMQASTTAYVDQYGYLHASTFVSGYAYETIPGQTILTGQMSDEP